MRMAMISYFYKVFTVKFINLIPIHEDDANQLACNGVVINDSVIFPSENIKIIETVAQLGCNIEISNVSEFMKSGGACQCLVITLQ